MVKEPKKRENIPVPAGKMAGVRKLCGPLLLLLLWQGVCMLKLCDPYLLPSPGKVLRALGQMAVQGQLLPHLLASLGRVAAGFALAVVCGWLLALLGVLFPKAEQWYGGSLRVLRTIPPLSLVPMVILWVGLGEGSKLLLIFLSAFFPVYLNAKAGLEEGSRKLLEVGRTLGLSRRELLLRIRLPGAVPRGITGMKLGLGYGWRALVGAEMLAATKGLGYFILQAQAMARTDRILAGIFLVAAAGVLTDWVFDRVLHVLTRRRWQY